MVLEGNCILTPVYPILEDFERTEEQLKKLKEAHFKRIELADAILVINKDNYIGKSTKLEIEYAEKLGKEAACPLGQAASHSFYPQGVWASVKQQSC